MSESRWDTHWHIQERWIIEGTLALESPAHFGNGDVSVATDMPLARDAATGQPLLTGASIAGALRSYLHAISEAQANDLFGEIRGNTAIASALIVNDALAMNADEVELRDGVAINPKTRTAEEKKKFDIELLPAGTRFDLCFELNVSPDEKELVHALAMALRGLEQGEIGLGKRKTRGLGVCKISQWRVRRYDVTQPQDLVAWLNDDRTREQTGTSIATLLGLDAELGRAARTGFSLNAELRLESSLLIRAEGAASNSPDVAHLHSRRNGKWEPILSGTSLAGALRARALRIANTLAVDRDKAGEFVDGMFGPRDGKLWASRVHVRESVIRNGLDDRVQSRVKIDRFTGGASNTALFSEQPVFGLPETRVQIALELVKAHDQNDINRAEVGLLLLLLKDLWTGDLPLGGESSVGRGRLRGRCATLQLDGNEWEIQDQDGKLAVQGNPEVLEQCVQQFVKEMQDA
jgi:CRISPR/Cas system CSM-associated protein Csm3 (group 7 of RAMP superfamily)